jgi:dimethylhistidine N-methyltransferase
MLYVHDASVLSHPPFSRAQRVPLPLPAAPCPEAAEDRRRQSGAGMAGPALRAARTELQQGLMRPQAEVSPKYLYDARGCELFEDITRLPEYYPTRTEASILAASGPAMAEALRGTEVLIELGAGNCEKVRGLCRSLRPRHFVGVDIAAGFLRQSVRRLAEDFPGLQAHAVAADITEPLSLPPYIPQSGRLLFYPGSSIGNFDPAQAQRMLGQMRTLLHDDGGLLIGIDLPKSRQWLEPAYDDAQGVTARFNLNLLRHVNALLGSDFDEADWEHLAFFNAEHSRIEMHLRARRPLIVGWPQGLRHFAAGETIHTENSYKYPLPEFLAMLACAGFGPCQVWTDERQWFALIHARA